MEKRISKVKKLWEVIVRSIKNPYWIDALSDDLDKMKQENTLLKNDNAFMKEASMELSKEIHSIEKAKYDLQKQHKIILTRLNEVFERATHQILKMEDDQIYEKLNFIDPEGWKIYRASQEILKLDVTNEYIVEDSMGWFEESDGYELKKYLEIAAFGDCTYKRVGGLYETLESYAIDYDSERFKSYLDALYKLANKMLIGDLYKLEPVDKMEFLQRHMEALDLVDSDQESNRMRDFSDEMEFDEIRDFSDEMEFDEMMDEEIAM